MDLSGRHSPPEITEESPLRSDSRNKRQMLLDSFNNQIQAKSTFINSMQSSSAGTSAGTHTVAGSAEAIPSKLLDIEHANYAEGEQPAEEFELSPYRWFILFQYAMATTASAFIMMSFAPIAVMTTFVYDVSAIWVNSCVMVFLISFVLLNFFSVQMLEKYGLKKTVSGHLSTLTL